LRLLRLHLSHLAIIVLTLNKFLWLKFEVFTGSPIHPPPLGALSVGEDERGARERESRYCLGACVARARASNARWGGADVGDRYPPGPHKH
jgi:hypothetical protein